MPLLILTVFNFYLPDVSSVFYFSMFLTNTFFCIFSTTRNICISSTNYGGSCRMALYSLSMRFRIWLASSYNFLKLFYQTAIFPFTPSIFLVIPFVYLATMSHFPDDQTVVTKYSSEFVIHKR